MSTRSNGHREKEKGLLFRFMMPRLSTTDRLIDRIIYRLYGLTEEEVAIVEGKGWPG